MTAPALRDAQQRSMTIDALRGIGALAVCAFHSADSLFIGQRAAMQLRTSNWDPGWWLQLVTAPFSAGGAGVALFFVLSGYCIHRPQALSGDSLKQLNLKHYLARRVWRIYPVLMAAVLLTAGMDCITNSFTTGVVPGQRDTWTFVANLLCLQGLFAVPYGTNTALWSLSVELHFYLLYPLLLWFVRYAGKTALAVMAFAISVASHYGLSDRFPDTTIFLPYLFTWVMGMVAAEWQVAPKQRAVVRGHAWIPCIGLVALGLTLWVLLFRFWSHVTLGLGFALLLSLGLSRDAVSVFGKRFEKMSARVGMFSYSLYATHRPLLVLLQAALLDGKRSANPLVSFLGIGVCTGFGAVVFWLIERWSLKLPRAVRRLTEPQASPSR